MFAISEVAPNGQSTGQSQSQAHVIASVVALQRVIAGQSGAESGDASARQFSSGGDKARVARAKDPTEPDPAADAALTSMDTAQSAEQSAEARSIVEAQEASNTYREVTAAFQARHGLTDLLSVIRDPEDLVLPVAPDS